MSLQAAFWRFAHNRYQTRNPSIMTEVLLFGWGIFWLAMFALSFASDFVRVTNFLGALLFAGFPLGLGLLHRRIRLVKSSGPDALYRKRLAANG